VIDITESVIKGSVIDIISGIVQKQIEERLGVVSKTDSQVINIIWECSGKILRNSHATSKQDKRKGSPD